VCISSVLACLALVSTSKNFCLTSTFGDGSDETDWVMTACPQEPGDIGDVERRGVGAQYVEEWEARAAE
jgi:hypothetical protein